MSEALRERRRAETVRHIRQAAMRLAVVRGAQDVTVEAICAEAGISVRTFFNYLPVREAAFVTDPPPFPPDAIAAFVEGRGRLLEELVALLVTRLPESGEEWRALGAAFEMAAREPRLAAMQISATQAHELELAELIARRLGAAPQDPAPALLAAAVLAATRVLVMRWAAMPSMPDWGNDMAPQLVASLRTVAAQLDSAE